MRRAISDKQKEKRRQLILDSAWSLFQQQRYDAISVVDVARGAGLAKGTVYLYFQSKEELFLAIQSDQFEAWFDSVDAWLEAQEGGITIAEVADRFTRSLAARPALVRLFAILHVTLEHNIPYESALAFKQLLRERVMQTGALLEARLPFLAAGQGAQLLLRAYALVIGIQHLADPAPVVRQVLQAEAELRLFHIDFSTEFQESFTTLCRGLECGSRSDNK